MVFFKRIKQNAYQEQKLQLWNSISYRVKRAGETSFNEMPLGIILFNDEFVIEWANNYAKKIFESELVESKANTEPSTVCDVTKDSFSISCLNGTVIKFKTIKPEGKGIMNVKDFMNGKGRTLIIKGKKVN